MLVNQDIPEVTISHYYTQKCWQKCVPKANPYTQALDLFESFSI